MVASPRFLIGYGERLTEPIRPASSGGGAPPPYEPGYARTRLAPQLVQAAEAAHDLPAVACPDGRVVSVMTLHPSFVAKSHFPARLLRAARLRSVGSRPHQVVPELSMHQTTSSDGTKRYEARPGTAERPTTELFLESTRAHLREWARHIQDSTEYLTSDEQGIVVVEQYRMPQRTERTRLPAELPSEVPLEVVLHAAGDVQFGFVLEAFEEFARRLDVEVELDRRLAMGSLCFVPALAPADRLDELAEFSFLRVVRPMPRLRALEPRSMISRSVGKSALSLPDAAAIDPDLRVVIFDGGTQTDSPLRPWVTSRESPGVSEPTDELTQHGIEVTSALLFGSIDPTSPIPIPYAHVDHYRVIDVWTEEDPYELYDVIRRIESILTQNNYSFINLSIGPALPIEDDEVHSWTAFLDTHLASGHTLATIAVGNNGEFDRPSGNARIQVPSDAVNALAVGAASSQRGHWDRAPYSSLGPGRTPGIIKPDILAFGGSPTEPFVMISENGLPVEKCGTSFAAPAALRAAVAVRTLFGDRLDPLVLKALLIHTAERHPNHHPHEHGWGRVRTELEPIVMCGEGIARVIYRGNLTPAKYLRAHLPIPSGGLKGNVTISATLTFATEVEPEHPPNYTRSGRGHRLST